MCKENQARLRIALAIGLAIGLAADSSAETMTETTRTITVESEPLPLLGGNRVIPQEGRGVASDGGELLRQVPGVSGSRLGGKGIDPTIRGMSQNRINILIDGAFVFGGCPNRMDPPASFANIEAYDQVTVLKGMQTLQHGAGGPGGTVLFERGTPAFSQDDVFNGQATASYAGNGDRHSLFVDAATGNDRGYLRLQASTAESNNYEDGNGDKVRSAYEEDGLVLNAGLNLTADTRAELSLEATRADDVYYAGNMDAPVDDNDTVRFKLIHDKPVGPFTSLFGEIYQTDVEHVMDNYSLRSLKPMMFMLVDVDSVTSGIRLQADLEALGGEWTIGFEDQDSDRDALRFASNMKTGGPPANVPESYMWPDVSISQTGIFAEGQWELSDVSLLKAGLRYDHVRADADKANVAPAWPMTRTANQLYGNYYGVTADKETEDNVGGLLRYERDFDGGTWFAGLSRTVRTADATERFMAANNSMDAKMIWVGNPEIDPEKHHQAEIGAAWNGNGWNTGVVVWVDWVDDYILRDRAHGQADLAAAATDSASVYRNVDARLVGFEIEGDWRPARNWKLAANAAYVRAKNTDEHRDIAETPPLELTASVDYEQSNWSLGAVLRAAARQTHVEDNSNIDSGLDVGETGGWGVVDLHGRYEFSKSVALDYGIDNLFDKTYAYHLNKANSFDTSVAQVNEPGRNAWVKVKLIW